MQSIPIFPGIKKVADFCEEMLMLAELKKLSRDLYVLLIFLR